MGGWRRSENSARFSTSRSERVCVHENRNADSLKVEACDCDVCKFPEVWSHISFLETLKFVWTPHCECMATDGKEDCTTAHKRFHAPHTGETS